VPHTAATQCNKGLKKSIGFAEENKMKGMMKVPRRPHRKTLLFLLQVHPVDQAASVSDHLAKKTD
jgi:hypothetical protein